MEPTSSKERLRYADRAKQIDALTGRSSKDPHPPTISPIGGGGKFTPDGTPLRFPGNTFLCHIDPDSQAFAALKAIQDATSRGPFADYFAFLPPESFHMTVFPSVCGEPLGFDGFPEGFDRAVSLEQITLEYAQRASALQTIKPSRISAVENIGGFSLHVDGATRDDAKRLRSCRTEIQELTGLYRSDFEEYQFHITLAYRLSWMSEDIAGKHLKRVNAVCDEVWRDLQSIALGPVELCQFDDMTHFETLMLLPEGRNS